MLDALLKNIECKACILDTSLHVTHYNDGFIELVQRVYGFKPNCKEHIFTNSSSIFKKSWKSILQNCLNNISFSEEVKIKQLVDSKYYKISISPLIVNKVIVAILIKVKDVTADTLVNLNLLAFKKLAENLPNTDVLLCDNKFNIILAGGGEMKKYGIEQDFYIGKNLHSEALKLNLDLLIPYYKRAKKGESVSVEYQFNTAHYWLEVVPVFDEKSIKNFIVITRNITELKEINIKLNQLNNTKDSILGIVAHDLRNPISAMLGFTNLIKTQNANYIQYLELINKSGNNALTIIADLLDLTELGNENYAIDAEISELNVFVKDIIADASFSASQKNITITFESNREDVFVKINNAKFNRVITNLLSNAIKFSHQYGDIKLLVEIKDNVVTFSISDNGIGIPEKLQHIIFDKFTKAGRRGTAGEKSIGLGMSIVKQIVNLHNGKIWINSAENEGTTVFIQLQSAI